MFQLMLSLNYSQTKTISSYYLICFLKVSGGVRPSCDSTKDLHPGQVESLCQTSELHVFGVWKETRVPRGNLQTHRHPAGRRIQTRSHWTLCPCKSLSTPCLMASTTATRGQELTVRPDWRCGLELLLKKHESEEMSEDLRAPRFTFSVNISLFNGEFNKNDRTRYFVSFCALTLSSFSFV